MPIYLVEIHRFHDISSARIQVVKDSLHRSFLYLKPAAIAFDMATLCSLRSADTHYQFELPTRSTPRQLAILPLDSCSVLFSYIELPRQPTARPPSG